MTNVVQLHQPAPSNSGQLNTWAQVKQFIFAGNATFTIKNTKTGNRYTYKVKQQKYPDPKVQAAAPYFVTLLSGPDNTADYTYMGTLFDSDRFKLVSTRKSRVSTGSVSWQSFQWLLSQLAKYNSGQSYWPAEFQFWHEGKCARCGRALTDPDSIARGYGPLCDMIERSM